ncbi:MAG: hypothetical protein WHV44_17675, partial [Anaerolineales bacterium]
MRYPITRKQDLVEDYHGTPVPDPYRWLEDADSAETAEWVRQQNEVTFGYIKAIPAQPRIQQRLTELWDFARRY